MLGSAFLFVLGILGLAIGTLLAVRGAVQVADRYGLGETAVGVAVLAVGTDLPELWVAITGGLQELEGIPASGMVVGSALGSAIAQGTLVLGVAGLVGYLPSGKRVIRRDGGAMLLAIVLAAVLMADGSLTRIDGAVLILTYGLYLRTLLRSERREAPDEAEEESGRLPPAVAIAGGLVTLTLGAHVVVTEGVALATALGVSQSLIAAIFVGVGTSLPELALSVRAAKEKHGRLAVGNIIGSNTFDLLIPIGTGAVIHPLTVDARSSAFDLGALTLVSLAALYFLRRRRGLQRNEALALVVIYLTYGGVRVYLG